MSRKIRVGRAAIAGCLAFVAGCAVVPRGSNVQVMPGPGKTFEAFQLDLASCRGFASQQVAGQADVANQRVVAGALLGVDTSVDTQYAQAGMQQQYDNAFSQCMYARGDLVPGYSPAPQYASGRTGVAADPLVRSVQSELIRLSYLRGGADGQLGPMTTNAIRTFERANGMAANGVASRGLLARLQGTTVSATAAAPAGSSGGAAGGSSASATRPSGWVEPVSPASASAVSPVVAAQPVQPVGLAR